MKILIELLKGEQNGNSLRDFFQEATTCRTDFLTLLDAFCLTTEDDELKKNEVMDLSQVV